MKRTAFRPPLRIEFDYFEEILGLLNRYLKTDETPANIVYAITNLASNPLVLGDMAKRIAARMVTHVRVSNARSWREAARKASRGRVIYEALHKELQGNVGIRVSEIVAQNAQLIGSIPADVRTMVNNEIAEWNHQGLRPETIAKNLRQRIPQLTKHKAMLIARTETGKASTALTRARSEDIGVNWYQWSTSEDQRVRKAHRLMDKVLVSWSDPPSPEQLAHEKSTLGHYNAGDAPNCRCDTLPVISLDVISWPARVYWAGSIRRMTRGQFAEFSGMRRAVAA